jgi:hypothetical protein
MNAEADAAIKKSWWPGDEALQTRQTDGLAPGLRGVGRSPRRLCGRHRASWRISKAIVAVTGCRFTRVEQKRDGSSSIGHADVAERN